ncbi:hypothetical protein AGMMS49944_15920 [Spirochaetia bacterium]|nr:hypothetical protein AGMMS49944_15920 [Spirochaetia bacterium]
MLYDKIIESLIDVKKAIKEKFGDDGKKSRGGSTFSSGPLGYDRIQYEIGRIAAAIRHATEGGGSGGGFDPDTDQITHTPVADQSDLPDVEDTWTWTAAVKLLMNKIKGLFAKFAALPIFGNIVTHAVSEFASEAQGAKADTALQSADLQPLADDVADIEALIPNQATSSNQLADKQFVNSTIATLAADYVTATANGAVLFATLAAVQAGPWYNGGASFTPQKGDYAVYANSTDGTWRATFDGAVWANAFQINTAPLTAAQVAALNSNITAALTALIATAVQEGRTIAGIALNADISTVALKTALALIWADIGGKPTTLGGYGITDAQPGLKAKDGTTALPADTPMYSKADVDGLNTIVNPSGVTTWAQLFALAPANQTTRFALSSSAANQAIMGMPNQGYYFFSISRGANDYYINLDNWTTGRKWFMKKSTGAQPITTDWNDITVGAGFFPQTEDIRTIAGISGYTFLITKRLL